MNLKVKSQKKKKSKTKGISKGLHIKEEVVVKPKPIISKVPRASIESFDTFMSDHTPIEGTNLPELSRCGILVEGTGKSGKTTLIAGNPKLVIIKCYDGHPITTRRRAKVYDCKDFETFEKIVDDLRHTAKKMGNDSPYCQVAIDPISALVRWLGLRAVAKWNKKKCLDDSGKVIPAMRDNLLESPSDMEGYGPWNSIADYVERLLISFGELGWGWIAPVHYQWKAGTNFRGGMSWQPNIPPTTADRIDKMADVQVSTEKDAELETYVLRYHSEVTRKLGARVPLTGYCELPNYLDDETDDAITSWDYFNADYTAACKLFTKDQTKFRRAYEALLEAGKV